MDAELQGSIRSYDPTRPLERAETIPKAFYVDPRMYELERRTVFSRSWQVVGRVDQLREPGQYVTAHVAGEPIVVVAGADRTLRAFFNVCRHHAAEVATKDEGTASVLRCPYHGWTYALDGTLKGAPEFDGVCDFDKAKNGLAPVSVAAWEQFVFVRLDASGPTLHDFLGDMVPRIAKLNLSALRFVDRRTYDLKCNWKVFVDNYLDGGYHVPHIHKGLGSVLSYKDYTIENRDRFCLQSSPVQSNRGEAETAAVRGGNMAYYYWLYPNFMLNWYEGYLDTNLVIPLGVDRTRVVFEFYMDETARQQQSQSVAVADRIQQEDIDVCESVQRGLSSRAYETGRLSVRREAGEHLFHRLLHADLSRGT